MRRSEEGREQAATLAAEVDAGWAEAAALANGVADAVADKKRVPFVLSLQGGRVLAAGAGTEAEGIMALSGAVNLGTGFSGYKPMTDEAVIAATPDAILMMDREGDRVIVYADEPTYPALSETPAGKAGRIVRRDGMLRLGFGPRTPEAARQLHAAIYPGAGG